MAKSTRNKTGLFTVALVVLNINLILFATPTTVLGQTARLKQVESELPQWLSALNACYGHHFTIVDTNAIVWNNGDSMILNDYKHRTFNELLENPDVEDQFKIPYMQQDPIAPPPYEHDPGRFRNQLFFNKMYGTSKQEIEAKLKPLKWIPSKTNQTLLVHSENGCFDSLQKVSDALSQLPDNLLKYVIPSAGTFNYRVIAGTNRLSTHSYGIAIDINVKHSHYWRWTKNHNAALYKNAIPLAIVQIFEKYGFIWGGRWYHFDTMHFEFRPELIKYKQ